jgi:uncharacterized protein YjbI with pentapeptide repeats
MANDEHVALLKQGVAAWNKWQGQNPNVVPELSGASLRGTKLSGANLRKAKLRRAKLSGANLRKAKLSGANLSGADLSGANLITAKLIEFTAMLIGAQSPWADLSEAYLVNPDLTGAKLRGAVLTKAELIGANLTGANLAGADLIGANLAEADLHEAVLTGANLAGASFTKANLRGADLTKAYLSKAALDEADLTGANLAWANLAEANFTKANLRGANLTGAYLAEAYLLANLRGAKLSGAVLAEAELTGADLRGANLRGANLKGAKLVSTDLTGADLTGCHIYGISAWGLKLERTKQQNLVITPLGKPDITVDNIEVAQFIYLLLHNERIRDVIDTIGKKGVLLLGRFTEGRMVVLDRLKENLREFGYVPMVFNFDKPETKDFTETVRLLANLSHFVIVDITNPRSAPLELQATVPDCMVPFVPILEQGQDAFAMFVDLQNKYDWVLQPVVGYSSVERLIEVLEDKIVRPAEAKFNELLVRRTKQLRVENV